jgi:hypothetical protein
LNLLSTTSTCLLPEVEPAGTVIVAPAGILPDPSLVKLKGTIEPAKVAKSGELAAKPLPETVNV